MTAKKVTYYKVLGINNSAKDGGTFDYTPYLPKKGVKARWTPTIKNTVACSVGYHITTDYKKWLNGGVSVWTVEPKNPFQHLMISMLLQQYDSLRK